MRSLDSKHLFALGRLRRRTSPSFDASPGPVSAGIGSRNRDVAQFLPEASVVTELMGIQPRLRHGRWALGNPLPVPGVRAVPTRVSLFLTSPRVGTARAMGGGDGVATRDALLPGMMEVGLSTRR